MLGDRKEVDDYQQLVQELRLLRDRQRCHFGKHIRRIEGEKLSGTLDDNYKGFCRIMLFVTRSH